MRSHGLIITLGILAVAGSPRQAMAQQPDSLAAIVARITARLDTLEQGGCPTAPAPTPPAGTDSVSIAVRQLHERLERLVAARCGAVTAAPAAPAAEVDELAALRAAATEAIMAGGGAAADTTAPDTVFVSRQRNGSAMNPEISATGDMRFALRDESPQKDNFQLEGVEIALQSTLDPYSTAKIILGVEQGGVGIEEGYLYYTGLPGRLRVDAGKFRQPVGDLNRWHVHALPETDYPLVYQRYLGENGLVGVGLSVYTALPVSLGHGTHELTVQGTTSEGEALYAGGTQPTLLGRLLNFWQLSKSTYVQLGFTGTGGNNADVDLKSRLAGADFRLTWRPPETGTRRELTFRAEGYLLHSDEAGFQTTRYGGFTDLNFKASRRWVLGVRGDWVEAPRGVYATEWAVVPTLTWWQSEFVYLRLEGRHQDGSAVGPTNLLQAQVVFAMGPHKHETY